MIIFFSFLPSAPIQAPVGFWCPLRFRRLLSPGKMSLSLETDIQKEGESGQLADTGASSTCIASAQLPQQGKEGGGDAPELEENLQQDSQVSSPRRRCSTFSPSSSLHLSLSPYLRCCMFQAL